MRLAAFLLFGSMLYGQQIYDLLLKNGRVIDPANHRDARFDVAVIGNRIVKVAPDLPAAHSHVVVEVSGYMITPGLIDINARFGSSLKPDYNTLPYGVTTAVDVGNCEIAERSKVRLLPDAECKNHSVASPGFVFRKSSPDAISSGMDSKNVLIPRANMATAMSIFLNLGMTPEQIIERVTSNPARAIKQPELGNLSEGSVADIAVLEIQQGKFGFLDSALTRLDGTRRFRCLLTVRNGVIVWDSDGLSIPDTLKAGPYTNFK
ncbi:MAG TPA: amidohydrolase family protein [Bryobacteraceae bacterium]|jgi:predicted amidohydrolase|nr:amidohydrolase family protein [Bryobacteraceae bacterium]